MPDSFSHTWTSGQTTVTVNKEKVKAKQDLEFYKEQVAKGRKNLPAMDARITQARVKVATAERDYQTAEEKAEIEAKQADQRVAKNIEIPLANAFDALLFAYENTDAELAVDPEAVNDLVTTSMEIPVESESARMEVLRPMLERKGFLFRDTSLENGRKVLFLTTPATWTYYTAIQQIKGGKVRQAHQTLSLAKHDDAPFGKHCHALQKALEEVFERNSRLPEIEKDIRENLRQYKLTSEMAILAEAAAKSAMAESSYRSEKAMAEANLNTARGAMERSCGSLQAFIEKAAADSSLLDRCIEANRVNLVSEAQYLFAKLSTDFAKLRELNLLLQVKGLERFN
jgi:hypothetical protein